MKELRVRLKRTHEEEIERQQVSEFCHRVVGTWWGRQWSDEKRLALLRIASDEGTNTVCQDGDTFDQNGKLFGRWKSVAMGIRVKEATLVFFYESTHPTISSSDQTFKGFGQYVFKEASGKYDHADGKFAEIQMQGKKPPRWTSVELRRVNEGDFDHITQAMENGTDHDRATVVKKAVEQFEGARAVKGLSLCDNP